ncbi:MAG TPA: exodeoxyribonuclease III [Blastocatellia bacterium]|nr:exodeoxyribonuclease III [Blastocatellia bacterium]
MKIATWNVNSISVRLPHVLDWLEANRPDALCLQEIKCVEARFPGEAFRAAGYHFEIFGQPSYNGVAIISAAPLSEVQRGFPGEEAEAPRRLIAARVGPVRVVNVYIPNGSEVGAEKYYYKLEWLGRLRRYFDEHCDPQQPVLLCGDFNVAPEDRDVHDPLLWAGRIHCSEPEREALKTVQDWGFVDAFRLHHPEPGYYSWWDYRSGSFRRDQGLRIDHIWVTPLLAAQCVDAWIDKTPRALERPSDHTPVVAEFRP